MCRKVKSCSVDEMLVPVRVQAELVPAPALDQAREAADLARAWGWAERPARQRLAQALVA